MPTHLSTNSKLKNKPAFTLVELLIAIVIMGILSSIIGIVSIGSQKSARDGKRKADLVQFKKALEAVKNDCVSGSYYPRADVSYANANISTSHFTYISNFLTTSNYLQNDLKDPKDPTYQYRYETDTVVTNACPQYQSLDLEGSKNFVATALLENTTDPDAQKTYSDCQAKIDLMNWSDGADPDPAVNPGYYFVCND